MPVQLTESTEAQSEAADRERRRIEDAILRATAPVLLWFTLDVTNSLLGRSSKSVSGVTDLAAIRLAPALEEGLIAGYLTARQRSLVGASIADHAAEVGSSAIPRPVAIPFRDIPTLTREIQNTQIAAPSVDHLFNRSNLLRPGPVRLPTRRPVAVGGGSGGRAGGGSGSGGGSGAGTAPRPPGASGGGSRPLSVNELAARFHERRLNLSPAEMKALQSRFSAQAQNIAGEVGNQMHKAATRIAGDLIKSPLSSADATAYIRNKLGAMGFTQAKPHTIETIYRTSVQMAYSAGQWEADRDGAIQEILWGYTYSTAADDRVCPICAPLDGLRLPKDDPAWDTITPPNHYNCRCNLVKVFVDDAESDRKRTEISGSDLADLLRAVPTAFAVNWGKAIRIP